MKRTLAATLFGLCTGIICFLAGKYGLKDDVNLTLVFYILANRTLAGYVIGISAIKIRWPLHGLFIGFIVGIPFSIGTLISEPCIAVFIVSLILGSVYGFLIELCTSKILGLKK
jgi:hypothetical protein